jgi:hypothetical protein
MNGHANNGSLMEVSLEVAREYLNRILVIGTGTNASFFLPNMNRMEDPPPQSSLLLPRAQTGAWNVLPAARDQWIVSSILAGT